MWFLPSYRSHSLNEEKTVVVEACRVLYCSPPNAVSSLFKSKIMPCQKHSNRKGCFIPNVGGSLEALLVKFNIGAPLLVVAAAHTDIYITVPFRCSKAC